MNNNNNGNQRRRRMSQDSVNFQSFVCRKIWEIAKGINTPQENEPFYKQYEILKKHNKPPTQEQINAIESQITNHSVIDSVAGSGKTFCIIFRILYIISQKIAPDTILAVTYTNAAVDEIKHRLLELVPQFSPLDGVGSPLVTTFHKLSQRYVGIQKHLPQELYLKIIKNIRKEEIVGVYTKSELDHIISDARFMKSLYDYDPVNSTHMNIMNAFRTRLSGLGYGLDSDYFGQLIRFYKFLQNMIDERKQFRWKHLLLDEMQDLIKTMFEAVKLMNELGCIVTLAGDSRQKIYSYSGLHIQISDLKNYFIEDNNGRLHELTKNFRCHKNIHAAAMQLFEDNKNISIDQNQFDFRVYRMCRSSFTSQCKAAILVIKEALKKNKNVAILFRMNKEKEEFQDEYVKKDEYLRNLLRPSEPSSLLLKFSTIHSTKGTECDFVIVFSFIEMNIPKYRPRDAFVKFGRKVKEKLEEEKRLTYVAITRARLLVLLLCPSDVGDSKVFKNWQISRAQRSSFLREMEPFVRDIHDEEYFVTNVLNKII